MEEVACPLFVAQHLIDYKVDLSHCPQLHMLYITKLWINLSIFLFIVGTFFRGGGREVGENRGKRKKEQQCAYEFLKLIDTHSLSAHVCVCVYVKSLRCVGGVAISVRYESSRNKENRTCVCVSVLDVCLGRQFP